MKVEFITRNPNNLKGFKSSEKELSRLRKLLDHAGALEWDIKDWLGGSHPNYRKAVPRDPGKLYAYKVSTNDSWVFTPMECLAIYEAINSYLGVGKPNSDLEKLKVTEAFTYLDNIEWFERLAALAQFFKDAGNDAGAEYI